MRFLPLSLVLLGLGSCSSPLDVGTERIDTRITNGLKLRTVSASVRIIRGGDTTLIEEWAYSVGSSSFSADTSVQPPGVTLRQVMLGAAGSGKTPWLKEIAIRLDGARADGAIPIAATADQKNGAGAVMMVDGTEYRSTPADNANASLHHFINNGRRTVQGTVVLGMNRPPAFSMVAAINFTASQD